MIKNNIIIEADKVFKYFKSHEFELRKMMHKIAECKELSTDVYVSSENGLCAITVYYNEEPYAEEFAFAERDCKETVEEIYDKYLTHRFLDEEDYINKEDLIAEREAELDDAVLCFLTEVLSQDSISLTGLDDIIEDTKEHMLEYLARVHNLPVYRPMFLEDEDEGEFFEEYPYECMVFEDDESNENAVELGEDDKDDFPKSLATKKD